MKKFVLFNEGVSSDAAEKTFAAFNEKLHTDPEQLRRDIADTAIRGAYETGLGLARVATDVLDETENGVEIGGSEAMWADVLEDSNHLAAQHDLYCLPETDSDERVAALRHRG